MGLIIFNGKSTEELGLISQAIPSYEFPAKNYSFTHIPGRNGDLIIDSKSYNNTERTYYLACVYKPGSNFTINSAKIIEWLMGAKGYCRLEDSYEPDVYRLASYVANGSLIDIMKTATTLNVTFNCKPQRYLKSGETALDFSDATMQLNNPTGYEALPILEFKPVSAGDLEIDVDDNTITVHISDNMINKTVIIDSELQNCFMKVNNEIQTCNSAFELTKFPVLKSGYTTIEFKDSTKYTDAKITPRWWKL